MEYWFNKKKGRELELGEWKNADYLQMGNNLNERFHDIHVLLLTLWGEQTYR